jgi:AcrR family transcriptional regulator
VPRAGLTTAVVVRDAADLADEVGLDRVTLATLAQRRGVALPSLYKHVRGLDALRQQVSALATAELSQVFATAAAGRSRTDALVALAGAYRDYARRYPGRYAASQRVPSARELAERPSEDAAVHVAAAERAVGTITAILSGYGLTGDDAIDATRALRSALHGFVSLEQSGGFGLPQDIDHSYAQLVLAMDLALQNWPGRAAG